jgi:hypothetical protein
MGLPVQLNYYSNADTSIIDLQNTTDGVIIGHHQVSLTNYNNTSLPAIAIGSVVENNGAMVKFTTECAISGSPSDGTVYIYLVPSGDPALGTATVTPTWTNTAPTWSDSKQGFYGTGGSVNYRYLEFVIFKSGSSYTKNISLTDNSNTKVYYTASDSTTRSTTSMSIVNETNLSLTINVIAGHTYSFILLFEASTSGTLSYIYNGDATWSASLTSAFLNSTGNTYSDARPTMTKVEDATYYPCCINSEYIARTTGSYTYYMSWHTGSGTVSIKNRRIIIQELIDKKL